MFCIWYLIDFCITAKLKIIISHHLYQKLQKAQPHAEQVTELLNGWWSSLQGNSSIVKASNPPLLSRFLNSLCDNIPFRIECVENLKSCLGFQLAINCIILLGRHKWTFNKYSINKMICKRKQKCLEK